jgi:ribosomal protein L24
MQGQSKGRKGRSITVYYNDYVKVSLQGYIKGSKGPFIAVNYNG